MSYIIGQEKPSLDDLAHYGKKGMKWGVRKQNRLERLQRVNSGKASRSDHLKTALFDTAAGNKRPKQHAAQLQAAEQLKAATESGKNVAGSILKYYGTRTIPGIASRTFNKPKK